MTVSVVFKIKILFKKRECSASGIKQAVPLGHKTKLSSTDSFASIGRDLSP